VARQRTNTLVTTQRLWCHLTNGKQLKFNYEEIVGFALQDWSLVLRFRSATPLRYGREQARSLPGMASILEPAA
jgi:hypothetical protein